MDDNEFKQLYPVCCIADIPTKMIETFLEQAYNGFKRYGQNEPQFAVIRDLASNDDAQSGARAPVEDYTSPFIGQSIKEVAKGLKEKSSHSNIDPELFIVLDDKTIEDETALIVEMGGRVVNSLRAEFAMCEGTLNNIKLANSDMSDYKDRAAKTGGVLRKKQNR